MQAFQNFLSSKPYSPNGFALRTTEIKINISIIKHHTCMFTVSFTRHYTSCHESCPCTPGYSPPEVTRSPHGLLHHTNGCTKTTFSIIHCTDDTQLITLIAQLIPHHTAYINHGLPLPLCRVLYSVCPSDSYCTEPSKVVIVLPWLLSRVLITCLCFLD